jgi:hypothetical protein
MPSYIENRAEVYGRLEELVVDPVTARACTLGWDITVSARMPQEGITMKMKVGVILGQQLAVQADRFLETIDESLNPAAGGQMKIRKEPILDPRATVHQAGGAGLWHLDTKKKPPRKKTRKFLETMAT